VRLAVTGANGFVGRQVVAAAAAAGLEVRGLVRSDEAARIVTQAGGLPVRAPGLEPEALAPAFEGAEAVVHLAHIGAERGGATYQAVNVEGTRRVAAAAKAAGVRRIAMFSGLGVAHYGMTPRCTDPYFRSKLLAEAALYDSGLEAAVFRPSYIVGPGDGYVPGLVKDMARGAVEIVGDGAYRMQPIAVRDAAACVVAALTAQGQKPRVFDLVGPEPIACRALVERVARLAGKAGAFRVREIPVAQADAAARSEGGYRGMGPDELDCLLCDEVGDARALESLLGRFLVALDDALQAAIRSA
jgi:NADH dehydrogenase